MNNANQTQSSSAEVLNNAARAKAREQLRVKTALQDERINQAMQMPPPEVLTIEKMGVLEIDHSATLLGERGT